VVWDKIAGMRARVAVLAAFVLLQVCLLGVVRHETLVLDVFPNDTPSPRIFGPRNVGQTFIARKNGLSRLDFLVGTYKQAIGMSLSFQLWEVGGTGALAAEKAIPGSELKDNLYTPVRFRPIRRSKGKTYKFIVSAPEAAAENSVSLWMNGRDIYREGEPLFNGSPAAGDFVFRAYAKRTVLAELGRITSKYPGFLGKRGPFVLAVLFVEAALIFFFWRLLGYFFGGKKRDA